MQPIQTTIKKWGFLAQNTENAQNAVFFSLSNFQNTSYSFLFCPEVTWHLANVSKATFSLLPFQFFLLLQQYLGKILNYNHIMHQFSGMVNHRSTVQNKATAAHLLIFFRYCDLEENSPRLAGCGALSIRSMLPPRFPKEFHTKI